VEDAEPIAAWRQLWCDRWVECGGDPAASLAREHGFVLTTASVRELGWTSNDVRRVVRRKQWSAPARGIVSPIVPDGGPDSRRDCAALAGTAAVLLRPGQVASGRSAAVVHGLPLFRLPDRPQVTARVDRTLGRRSRTHVYSAGLSEPEITDWFGAPVTTAARTLVDLGRHDRRDAIIAADAALRERLVTRASIDAALARAVGWPYSRQAAAILDLADPRAESPLESLVRLALHDDGFPPPELQYVIGPYRVDFYWPQYGMVLEADGRLKYDPSTRSHDDQAWRDKQRDMALIRYGVRTVERVVWDDVVTTAAWLRTSRYLRARLRASSPA
jgi:very-short-patch-repair endonuclease